MEDDVTEAFDEPFVIDAASPLVAEAIAATRELPAYRFRSLGFLNRPAPSPEVRCVGLYHKGWDRGGAERVIAEDARLFVRRGLRVVLYIDEGAFHEGYDLPSEVVCKSVPLETSLVDRVRFWRSEMRAERIDVFVDHACLTEASAYDCLAVQSVGTSYFYHSHYSATFFMADPWDDRILDAQERLVPAADQVLALSEADALFFGAYSPRVRAVPNPVVGYLAEEPPRAAVPQGKTVVFCGRLHIGQKGLEQLVRTFAELRSLAPDARLRVVGGPLGGEGHRFVQGLAEELGVADGIEVLGARRDVLDLIRSANVLLMTSPSEGFPMVLTEACALGVPAVIYELPYITLLEHDRGGVVQVPQGQPAEAARVLARLLDDPELQGRMGRAARATYESLLASVDDQKLWDDLFTVGHLGRSARAEKPSAGRKAVGGGCRPSPSDAVVRGVVNGYKREMARLREAEDALARAREERDAARSALACVEGSASFRAGRAVTAAPRAVRTLLERLAKRGEGR